MNRLLLANWYAKRIYISVIIIFSCNEYEIAVTDDYH